MPFYTKNTYVAQIQLHPTYYDTSYKVEAFYYCREGSEFIWNDREVAMICDFGTFNYLGMNFNFGKKDRMIPVTNY